MNRLHAAVDDYLKLRRALGFKLRDAEPLLRNFVSFMQERKATIITTALALQWSQLANCAGRARSRRLGQVRDFARHCRSFDQRHEVPPTGLLPSRWIRKQPYLYTLAEIKSLMDAALSLPPHPQSALRPYTLHCLLGLLTVTGLRSGEAFALRREDVDLKTGLLTIRQSKFGKSRLVPLHSSARSALARYAKRRDRHLGGACSLYFFVGEHGGRINRPKLYSIFNRISCQVGLRSPSARRKPRLHDLRHRFAVETLLNWCRHGEDVERHLPTLSTFLGHTHSHDTYWYLSASPQLMRIAAHKLAKRWEKQP